MYIRGAVLDDFMRIHLLFLITISLALPQALFASWIKTAKHPFESLNKIATSTIDQNNNLLFAGYFNDEFEMDTFQLKGSGSHGFIGKSTPSAEVLWLQPLISDTASSSAVSIKKMVTDNLGNIYATGSFQISATIGNTLIKSTTDNKSSNGLLLKFDPQGHLIWFKTFTNPLFSRGETLSWSGNRLYLGVSFNISFNYDNTNVATTHPYADNNYNSALLCLSEKGDIEWATVINAESCIINSTTVDAENIYTLCTAKGQPYINPNGTEIIFPLNHALGLNDNYLICQNKTDGTVKWSNQIGSPGYEIGQKIYHYNNAIYCAGSYNQELKCKSQDGNMQKLAAPTSNKYISYIAKYNNSGELIWSKKLGDNTSTTIFDLYAYSNNLVTSIIFKDSINISSQSFYTASEGTESIIATMAIDNGEIKNADHTTTKNINSNFAKTHITGSIPLSEKQTFITGYSKGRFTLANTISGTEISANYTSFIGLLEPSVSISNRTQPRTKFYPNPTTGVIHFTNVPAEINTLQIFNTFGQLIASIKLSSNSADLSFLLPGYYMVNCGNQFYKLIVE